MSKLNLMGTPAQPHRIEDALKLEHEELLNAIDTTADGLTASQAEERLEKNGYNEIVAAAHETYLMQLWDAFANPFSMILVGLAIVTFISDLLSNPGVINPPVSVYIMLGMVLLSGLMRFIQTMRQTSATENLKKMVHTMVTVRRDSKETDIPLRNLVEGDLVVLTAGDMIPGDLKVLSAIDLFVSQSALTGESDPVEKHPKFPFGNSLYDQPSLLFMGTNVVSGSGTAMVVATGSKTVFGTMARKMTEKRPLTAFELGVQSVSSLLMLFMALMVPAVFLINGFSKHDWMSAFFFALSVAVGLTPEMLPMIVTLNLNRGAMAMAKKKVIVKNLHSIQNFGSMDILCTDKTGTLTQDRVVLEMHLDVHGNEDIRVLRHAFLNSYYQTGLKNLMDLAIISHAKDVQLADILDKYQKIDEIPFDFTRRRMSVILKNGTGKTQMVTKGAVEEMLSICTKAEYQGEVIGLDEALRAEVRSRVEAMNQEGFRVLAIAQKRFEEVDRLATVKDETDMVLMGYLTFLDPAKLDAKEAVAALHQYGVDVKILTGDNDAVTSAVCKTIGILNESILLGAQWDLMNPEARSKAVEEHNIFAKLSPDNKGEIVTQLRKNGHTVGFMGDGINDAHAMRVSDVGISVDSAVDIAKESADIILLEKDLMVLEQGVIEGRNTFGNISKYIRMTVSSNFGNMFSVLFASIFLPFLPMLPVQILVLNLIYDFACIAIPWDSMDADYALTPKKWDTVSIRRFILWIGPISSIFDIATFGLMYFIIAPSIAPANSALFMTVFQSGWFVESLFSQMLIVHNIRSKRIPFIGSRSSWQLAVSTVLALTVCILIPISPLGSGFGLTGLPLSYYGALTLILVLYFALAQFVKLIYVRKYDDWI